MNEIVRMDGVSKVYGSKQALNNVQLVLKSGQITALLGPNGSGNTHRYEAYWT